MTIFKQFINLFLSTFLQKHFEQIFAALYFYIYVLKKYGSDFKKLQNGDTNISVLFGALFNRYVQLKSSFSDEKNISIKSETHASREAIKINVTKY